MDYLNIDKQLNELTKAWRQTCALGFIIAFTFGMIFGAIIHDWLYNHAH